MLNPVLLLLLSFTPAVQGGIDFNASIGDPGETAPGPGGRLAWTVETDEGQRLYLDGALVVEGGSIEDLSWTRGGDLVYWIKTSRGQRVVQGDVAGRIWDEIRTPDLDALARSHDPTQWNWTDRGGASMAFAARDRADPDRWLLLTRRPSQPWDNERRPLATVRTVREAADPGVTHTRAIRYHLIQGRVPAYIGRRGKKECLVVGRQEMACGHRIEMIAAAPRTGRLLVAWRVREGEDLYLSDGIETTGPWRRIDWASFSQDGLRYAVMVADHMGDRIQTDQLTIERPGRLAALAHLSDGALAALWFLEDHTVLFSDERVITEGLIVDRFLRPPEGDPLPLVRDEQGIRVGSEDTGLRFHHIWGAGFLPNGSLAAQVTPLEGGQGLLVGSEIVAKGDALLGFMSSIDGTRMLTVLRGRESGLDHALLDGSPLRDAEEILDMGFVGAGPVARPWILERRGAQRCLWTSQRGSGACCPEVTGWSGTTAAPLLLCRRSNEAFILHTTGLEEAADEIPPALITVAPDGRVLWFAIRKGGAWSLRGADGRDEPLSGVPRMLVPGPAPGDHPCLLLQSSDGQGWSCGGSGEPIDAQLAHEPHEVPGVGPVYASRRNGRVRWIGPDFETPDADQLGSAPHLVPSGIGWWERRDNRWVWSSYPYDDWEQQKGGGDDLP